MVSIGKCLCNSQGQFSVPSVNAVTGVHLIQQLYTCDSIDVM